MSPVWGSVAKKPSSAPVRTDVARDIRRLLEHGLNPAHDLVGLDQGSADRHLIVEHEGSLVHVGHEARLHVRGQPPQGQPREQGDEHRDNRQPEPDLEEPLVAVSHQGYKSARSSASACAPGSGRRARG